MVLYEARSCHLAKVPSHRTISQTAADHSDKRRYGTQFVLSLTAHYYYFYLYGLTSTSLSRDLKKVDLGSVTANFTIQIQE